MNAPRTYIRESLALSGAVPDLIPEDAPGDAWNDASNVIFRNGESLRTPGDLPILPGASISEVDPPRACVYLRVGPSGFWVYVTLAGIYAHDGTNEYDITPAAWTPGTFATFTAIAFNGLAIINTTDTDPVYWTGDTLDNCVPLPGWPVNGRCIAMRAHKNFLFAVGMISEGGQRVRWSDAAEAGTIPQTWEPAADNLAGFVDLTPLAADCLDGLSMRDTFVVYKNESIWHFDFVGGNAVFQVRKAFSEHGIINTGALSGGIDDVHAFVGADGDCYLSDGVNIQSMLDGRAQRAFRDAATQNTRNLFRVVTLSREKLCFIMYPGPNSATMDRAIAFDFSSGAIGFRQLPNVLCAAEGQSLRDVGDSNTWDGDPASWNSDGTSWGQENFGVTLDDVIVGSGLGFASISEAGQTDFLTGPVTANLSKMGLAFGNPAARKMINRVWPKLTGRLGDIVEFRIGGQETSGGPVSLSPPLHYVIGSGEPLDVFQQGRFLSIEVASEGGLAWRLGSIDIEYREVGQW